MRLRRWRQNRLYFAHPYTVAISSWRLESLATALPRTHCRRDAVRGGCCLCHRRAASPPLHRTTAERGANSSSAWDAARHAERSMKICACASSMPQRPRWQRRQRRQRRRRLRLGTTCYRPARASTRRIDVPSPAKDASNIHPYQPASRLPAYPTFPICNILQSLLIIYSV